MDKVNPASPSGCVMAWTELRTVTHSRETHTHTHSRQHLLRISSVVRKSPLFFLMGLCLEEHIVPGYGLPIRNRSLVPVIGEGSKACVWEESWVSCSLRRTMSVHSCGEFDLMRICSTVPLWIQACRWRLYVLIYIPWKFDECHSFFAVFSNQHLVWWSSKLPEKPWVMCELRCESNSMTMIESCQCWERERSSVYPRLPPDCKLTPDEHKRSCLLNSRMDFLYVLGWAVTLR